MHIRYAPLCIMHNMARITFSIPDDLAELAERRAKEDRRSLSAHISLLVENDARQAGLISIENDEADLGAAIEEVGGKKAAIAALRREAKKKRRAA